jgi:hypothetical protein
MILGLAGQADRAFASSALSALAPLPDSNYAVRPVCARPAPGTASCLALHLVPTTAAARARTHPLGMTKRRAIRAASAAEGSYGLRPQDLHGAYGLPTVPIAGSSPQTIAIVDAYNDPTAESDLKVFDEEFKLPACTTANGCFNKVNQEGKSSPLPATEGGWALEISLDIQTSHAICQSCHILLVEASSNSEEALEAAEQRAVEDGATEISNSWGGSAPVSDSPAFNHPGVVITASSGDYGYLNWDAPFAEERGFPDYPAASPHVVGVGGTHLRVEEGAWKEETVWNQANNAAGASGGGCSGVFTAQPWQQAVPDWSNVGCGTHRAVADVAADADPYTGVALYDSTLYEGKTLGWTTVGGTSLASPIIASTFALDGGAGGVSYPSQTLYSHIGSGSLHDVVSGSNGGCSKVNRRTGQSSCTLAEEEAYCSHTLICNAASGYDGPTGVGTPDGLGAFSTKTFPHAYKNLVKGAEGTALRWIAWGTLKLSNATLGEIECHDVMAGFLENPTGGGPAVGKIQGFAPYECVSESCKALGGTAIEVTAETLPWSLAVAQPQPSIFRMTSGNGSKAPGAVSIRVNCVGVKSAQFLGEDAPKLLNNGLSAGALPTEEEFDQPGSGELISEGLGGLKFAGRIKIEGYVAEEVIELSNP